MRNSLSKTVQKFDSDNSERNLTEIKSRMPELSEDFTRKKTFSVKKKLWIALSPLCAVVLCLSIALPIMLVGNRDETDDGNRYNETVEYTEYPLNHTVKEYDEIYGLNILFLDLYSASDEWMTYLFKSERGEEYDYIREEFLFGSNYIRVSASRKDVVIDLTETYETICKNKSYIDNIEFSYYLIDTNLLSETDICSYSFFEYGDYKYYINTVGYSEYDDLVSIVELLLSSANT